MHTASVLVVLATGNIARQDFSGTVRRWPAGTLVWSIMESAAEIEIFENTSPIIAHEITL